MQVDLSTAISIVSLAVGAYLVVVRYALGQKERELDRRLGELEKQQTATADRLVTEEKATIRQDGAIHLVQQTHSQVIGDIAEIKAAMVTRAEWEPRTRIQEANLTQVLSELRNIASRGYGSYRGMPAVQSPPPPPTSPVPPPYSKKDPR